MNTVSDLSPEIQYYMETRGITLPQRWQQPLIQTPSPGEAPGAVFDEERVDHVLAVFNTLSHTQGRLAGRPLTPDPWQIAYILAPIFGWVRENQDGEYVRIIREAWAELPRKNGKLVALSTEILTDRGWLTVGDLKVGDWVYDINGNPTEVLYMSDNGDDPCYRVTFADGQQFTAGAGHLWTVYDRWRERWVTVETQQMADNYIIGNRSTHNERRYSVSTDRVINTPVVDDLLIDPYVLGAWLGDGTKSGGGFTNVDLEIIEEIRSAGYDVSDRSQLKGWYIKGLVGELRYHRVLNNKHVPEEYLLGSPEQRLALLQGLMDTDGYVSTKGQCEFCNTNKGLAESVLYLARSLGYKSTLVEHRATLNGKDCGPKYRVFFHGYKGMPPFRLHRKFVRLRDEKGTRSTTNKIVSIERVDTVPTRCIMVDHEEHQFLIGRGFTPTHNTTLAGGVAILLTCADHEPGAQVLAAATTRDQAGFCFRPIAQLATSAPILSKHVQLYRSSQKIIHKASGSYFQAISNVADAQHGANIHGAIVDEVHVHKTAELIEAIETGTGSRRQPLILFITTADDGRPDTVYNRKRRRIEQLSDKVITDPTVYGVVWAAGRNEREMPDPFSEETWRIANPGYGISPTKEYLAGKAAKAKDTPAEFAEFLRLHLGIRTKQTTRWVGLSDWDATAGNISEDELEGCECVGGLDLASVSDITALCWTFPDPSGEDKYTAIWRFWLPEAQFRSLNQRTAGEADVWVRGGHLILTPGEVIDNQIILDHIDKDAQKFRVQGVAFDRWGATDVTRRLDDGGINCIAMGQGVSSYSGPMKEWLRLIKAKQYIHGGNPVMRWMVDNLVVFVDPSGNVKPDKSKASDKIDGVSAAVMSLSEAINLGGSVVDSIW